LNERIINIIIVSFFTLAAFALIGIDKVSASTVSAKDLKGAVRSYVEKHMPWQEGNIRVLFPEKVKDIQLPGAKISYEIRGRRNDPFIGTAYYTVNIYEDDVLVLQERIRTNLEVCFDIAVSTRAIEKDSEVSENDIRFDSRWFSSIPSNAVTSSERIIGKRLISSIRPNCEITKNMLKSVPMVRRGGMVRIVLDKGLLRIMTIGQSEENGARNDFVKIRNVSSGKILYARVIDENTVKIDY